MSDKNKLWNDLIKAERKARSGKWRKLVMSPLRYPSLLFYNYALYPLFKKGISVNANTFFGRPFKTIIPSGTDIMLNGIKSHESEIRLTKYLVLQLNEGDIFIDVGAHYGYYSLLASKLVGEKGFVLSLEPSLTSYHVLKENTVPFGNIETIHAAAGDQEGIISFFEYPGPLAEYNTTIADVYSGHKWHDPINEKVNQVKSILLDRLIENHGIEKAVIKIDVEGGEASVLKGLSASLHSKQLIIAMEYLYQPDGGNLHYNASQSLIERGYHSFAITKEGTLEKIKDIDQYLLSKNFSSDNIIFLKNDS